jgi:acyl-CoA thioester hydrolase
MPYVSEIDVRFRDLDALGHVNNVVYMTYVEQARVRYFDHVFGDRHDWDEWGVLLARTEINYERPLLFKEDAKCRITCTALGAKSMRFSFEIFKLENDQEVEIANGINVLVCFNHTQNTSINVPEYWRTTVNKFEQL